MKWIALALALAACKSSDAPPSPSEPERGPRGVWKPDPQPVYDAGPVLSFDLRAVEIAKVTRDRTPVPARFAAALPKTDAEWARFAKDDPAFPPADYVKDGLCTIADPSVIARVTAAGSEARWKKWMGQCGGEALCASALTLDKASRRLLAAPIEQSCNPDGDRLDKARFTNALSDLRRAGLVTDVNVPTVVASDDYPFEVLAAGGRADAIDTEADEVPLHTHPLRRLAYLVRPDLDGVMFEQDGNTLRAYLDGDRFSTDAAPQNDYYDLDAAVGLVNAMLAARKAPHRILVLEGGGQEFLVAAGTLEQLDAAARAGLIHPYRGGN